MRAVYSHVCGVYPRCRAKVVYLTYCEVFIEERAWTIWKWIDGTSILGTFIDSSEAICSGDAMRW